MKCNMCHEDDMKHEYVLYNKRENNVLVVDSDEEIKGVDESVRQGSPSHNGRRIVHIYNCPNSQMEYYQPEDAVAYELAMNKRNTEVI